MERFEFGWLALALAVVSPLLWWTAYRLRVALTGNGSPTAWVAAGGVLSALFGIIVGCMAQPLLGP